MKRILGPLRRAIEDYDMIKENDVIAVGVSGGKDSLTLITALHHLSQFYPKKFKVIGLTLDLGIDGCDFSELEAYFKKEGIEHHIRKTNIYDVVFNIRKEKNPCSLCARLRRGYLNTMAIEMGATKIALGHHYDDVLETFMMNLIHEGRVGCFSPITFLDRTGVTIIRPMIYLQERNIKSFVNRYDIPVVFNPCVANGNTERTEMKHMLSGLEKRYKGVQKRIFGALQRSGVNDWYESSPNPSKKEESCS